MALTLIADAWASAHGRDLVVLTVDHGLRPESAAWTDTCARLAGRLGRPFEALAWAAEQKPATGLPAAARSARHRLLAEAARRAGARVLLLGHTADDVAEAAAMRAAGSTTPSPREWSPSPVWPEGRGLFVLRPLLEVSRADLRVWLTSRGETWIDDPANTDLRFARSRARAAGPLPVAATLDAPLELAALAAEAGGVITLPRRALASAPEPVARRFVALASVCAGGGERTPARGRAERLARALRVEGPIVATLAGARIEADAQDVRIFRNVGEAARGGLAEAQRPGVWDGRFELGGAGPVRRLAGVARGLDGRDSAAVAELPAAARGGLPVAVDAAGRVTLLAAPDAGSLVGARLRAAAGLVQREPA